jgi:selenocysteine-specific elongation factor
VIDELIAWCERRQLIARDGAGVRLPEHRVALDSDQQHARDTLLAALDATPFAPPALTAAATAAGVTPALLREMEAAGQLVRLSADIAMTPDAIGRAVAALREIAATEGPLTASQARQVLDTSRKFVLPLLEELDRRGVTVRSGDTRTFR